MLLCISAETSPCSALNSLHCLVEASSHQKDVPAEGIFLLDWPTSMQFLLGILTALYMPFVWLLSPPFDSDVPHNSIKIRC